MLLNSVSAHSFIQNTAVFFVGAWIQPLLLGAQQRTIIGNNATAVTEAGIIFSINPSSGTLRCQLTGGGVAMINVSSSVAIRLARERLNQWTHIGVSGNGTNITFYIYDGTFRSETPVGTISTYGSGNSTFPLMIGVCNGASLASPFGGLMDDVVISSVSYSLAEYQDLVLNGNRPSAGRVSFYKFDEGSGSVQTDTDGTKNGANTGTIYSSTAKYTSLRSAAAARSAAATRSPVT